MTISRADGIPLAPYPRHAEMRAYLAEIRKRRGLSQAALAELLDTQQSAISELENGTSGVPNLNTLARWAAALDLDLAVQFTERVQHSFGVTAVGE
ncbi:helix-turn-helix domain-containing protein [Actinoplanes sp. CA-051413]|uniref:helix-turn-helix domain-containing protein n=1 Tax=Actinoplanes sp. CA-051413 TaxID=3239899 RepID=UPI003D994C4F